MIREEILDWTSYLKEHLSNARSSVKIFSFYLIIIFNDLLYFKKTNNKSFLKCEVSRVLGLVSRPVHAIRVSGGGLEPSTNTPDNSPDKLDRWRHIRNRSQRLGTRLVVANSVSGFQIVGTPRKQFQAKIRRSWLSTPSAIFSLNDFLTISSH